MTARTVLYIHGLEAGPEGRKPNELRRVGFTVIAEQMPCGRRQVARDPVVLASGAMALGAVGVVARRRGLGVAGAVGAAFGLLAFSRFAQVPLFRRVIARSLWVQRAALARGGIDAVVGSSFGGAVALALLQEGAWRGPTLLLCPAHELVAARAGVPAGDLAGLPAEIASRVLVVHGSRDETVPLASSERLVRGSAARLVVVKDDHRLKASATGEQMQAWLAEVGVAAADP